MSKFVSIAIDGPAGAGKSTMARACAQALGYLYVDTGAIYRTVGYYMRLMGASARRIRTALPASSTRSTSISAMRTACSI